MQFAYDAMGRRVEKVAIDEVNNANNKTHRFLYDGQDLALEYNQDNELIAAYTYSGLRLDDVLSIDITDKGVEENRAKISGSFFFLKDALGSIIDVTDESGNILQHYAYAAFGKILKITDENGADISSDPTLSPYLTYTGREFDKESGLYYYRARYYDSEVGRFISIDPAQGDINDPASVFNRYAYVGNNPNSFTDPSGAIKFREIVSLTASFAFGFIGGFIAGAFLGSSLGAAIGGAFGYFSGGEIAFRTNRLLGGSEEESRELRKKGRFAGSLGGTLGGIAGGLVTGNTGIGRDPSSTNTSTFSIRDGSFLESLGDLIICGGAVLGLGLVGGGLGGVAGAIALGLIVSNPATATIATVASLSGLVGFGFGAVEGSSAQACQRL